MDRNKLSGKREARLVQLVALLEAQGYIMLPTDAGRWAKMFGVAGQIIRADIRLLREEGYLPHQRLAILKKRFKPEVVKGV
jgi:hypothetical protein